MHQEVLKIKVKQEFYFFKKVNKAEMTVTKLRQSVILKFFFPSILVDKGKGKAIPLQGPPWNPQGLDRS